MLCCGFFLLKTGINPDSKKYICGTDSLWRKYEQIKKKNENLYCRNTAMSDVASGRRMMSG